MEGSENIYGMYKVQENLSYLNVFQAGHNLAFWRKFLWNWLTREGQRFI
jgi:enterochelin esterase-like enzyme